MSLSKTTLSAIQRAGQALHQATVVVSGAVREQAEHMVSTVASQPFEAEGEQAFANFKMLARLSQDLQSLEEKLRALYATASELASPEMDVVTALPHAPASSHSNAKDAAEDAVVKPARSRPARPPRPVPVTRASKAAKPTAKTAKCGKAPSGMALTANDSKLMDFLKTVLNRNSATRITGYTMSRGAGLPMGSVGISLKRILASGAVKKDDLGRLKLGA
jgi:hypothetical protein